MSEMKKTQKHGFAYGFAVGTGVALLALVLIFAAISLSSSAGPGNIQPPNPPDRKGVFYGQVVDFCTLDPIPNATVHLCARESFDDLVTTVVTGEDGYYHTTNITLPGFSFYVSASALGYYSEPLGMHSPFSGYETASQVNSSAYSTYSISPV